MSMFSIRLCQTSIIFIASILFSACGGSSASDSTIDTSMEITQEAVVMVSENENLTHPTPLENAELDSDNIYFFFQEGSDWSTRGISRVDFYCCKGGTEKHIKFHPMCRHLSQQVLISHIMNRESYGNCMQTYFFWINIHLNHL